MDELTQERLLRALSGDLRELRSLVETMVPVVRARVVRSLSRYPHAYGSAEVEDLTQEVFATLFAADAKLLRKWEPERGLSLRNFVGLLTQHRVAELLRGKLLPMRSETSLDESQLRVAQPDPAQDGEGLFTSQDVLKRLLTHLEATLSVRGLELFERLYVKNETVAQICEDTGMSAEAVYKWRSRLAKAARDGVRALEGAHPHANRGREASTSLGKGRVG